LPYPFDPFPQRRAHIGIGQKRLAAIGVHREEIGGTADGRTPVVGRDGLSKRQVVCHVGGVDIVMAGGTRPTRLMS